MDRSPWDEDVGPSHHAFLALPNQKQELSLKDVEQLVGAVVNMARWTVCRRGDALEDADGASRLLGGRYERYVAGSLDRSALARSDDNAPRSASRSGIPRLLSSRLIHRLSSPLP